MHFHLNQCYCNQNDVKIEYIYIYSDKNYDKLMVVRIMYKYCVYVYMWVCVSTSAMLHVGLFAPNRPIGELCTNGKFGALDLLKRFLNSSFLACAPNSAAFGLSDVRLN